MFVQRSRMCRTQCCPIIAWTCPCLTTAASPLKTSCNNAARPVPAKIRPDPNSVDRLLHAGQAAYAMRSFGTQANERSSSAAFLQSKKWREKEKVLKPQNERLRSTVDTYKKELERLKKECHISKFLNVVRDSELACTKAKIILDQVINYKAKKPIWSETTIRQCTILHHLSAKSYEHMRTENLLSFPCRNTLRKYLGSSSGEVRFSELIKRRLSAELECLTTPQSKLCSLVVDEMRIRQKLEYHKQRDAFLGDIDLSADLNHLLLASDKGQLANSLLCFLLCALHASFKIPVEYFFTKGCSGELLAKTVQHVIRKTEEVGFRIVRLVTDNHKVNIAAMEKMSQGHLQTKIRHPVDPSRYLFLAFDQSHIIKNIRSQFLSKQIACQQKISAVYLKDLYRMQQGSLVKPVRFLTRKHVYPSDKH
ncbi:hypothetical protein HPB51_013024 [Rhipicephalus microplus]|uniref:Transposable element P transposase-like RNase H domain-containing protein n=1 Tax=Rhipicephalus microplus TaxID=6941 RepID=A0A9J6F1Z9_RHIMP|nr:hypothetical protein HPB51_013024 [Rhipicephalus microplus]